MTVLPLTVVLLKLLADLEVRNEIPVLCGGDVEIPVQSPSLQAMETVN